MIIINLRGEDFFYDVVSPQTENQRMNGQTGKKEKSSFIESLFTNPNRGYRVCWPYVTFSGIEGYLWIFCAHDQKYMKRVELPKDHGYVCNTFITSDFYIYVVLQSDSLEKFTVFSIDLRYPKAFAKFNDQIIKFKKIMEYTFEQVENKPMDDLFFRSEARNEESHEDLFGFFLHGDCLYQWTQG